jgi:undecaprenyl-diphosphatase
LVLNFGVTDIVSSSVIKPLVERPRPCHGETMNLDVRLLVDCGSGFSFTSSHATNHFGLAFFLIFTLGKRWKYIIAPLIVWAVIVAYAQVYVGVHYPLDVLSGALLGICIAFMLSEMYKFTIRKLEYRKHKV